MFKKIICVFTILFMTNMVFANPIQAMKIQVTSNLNFAGTAFLFSSQDQSTIVGPILDDKQSKFWSANPRDELYAIGVIRNGFLDFCVPNDGYFMTIDPEQYTGDQITITYTGVSSSGDLQCTCSGSACTTSASVKIKK